MAAVGNVLIFVLLILLLLFGSLIALAVYVARDARRRAAAGRTEGTCLRRNLQKILFNIGPVWYNNFVLGCYTTFPRADKAQNWRNAPFQAGNIYAIISKWHIMDFNHYVAVFARGKK